MLGRKNERDETTETNSGDIGNLTKYEQMYHELQVSWKVRSYI
jgi:hypothetical protein